MITQLSDYEVQEIAIKLAEINNLFKDDYETIKHEIVVSNSSGIGSSVTLLVTLEKIEFQDPILLEFNVTDYSTW